MDLSQAQEDRILKAYEIVKLLMRQLAIFPRRGQYEKQDNDKVLEIDEFDRGWPMMTLEHLSYIISAVINLAEGKADEEPQMKARGFQGKWREIRGVLLGQFGGGALAEDDDDDGGSKRKTSRGPKFGDMRSWKVLSSRITRIRKLGVFDRDANEGTPLQYQLLLQPGRVNIIDLSDLENNDVRNLAIAEVLRGIAAFQQRGYDDATAKEEKPLSTNIIIEEAHEFLSAKRVTKMPTLRDQLVKIAKRATVPATVTHSAKSRA